jgi:DNA polymerase/3'-5' exonuclease PolX
MVSNEDVVRTLERVARLRETGRLGFPERLEAEVPPTLVTASDLPGVGPLLGLDWLPPDRREDGGEVETAERGQAAQEVR